MISIILSASEETKKLARAAGFTEQTVLVRNNSCMSDDENKGRLERELFAMGPYQFVVSDYFGMGPD